MHKEKISTILEMYSQKLTQFWTPVSVWIFLTVSMYFRWKNDQFNKSHPIILRTTPQKKQLNTCGGLTLLGARCPPNPLCDFLPQLDRTERNRTKGLWVGIKTGRYHSPSRVTDKADLTGEKNNLIYVGDWRNGQQAQNNQVGSGGETVWALSLSSSAQDIL